MSIGLWQIILIVAVIVLLFGAGRVPRLMEDIGKGINSFKKGLKGEESAKPKTLEQHDDQDRP